MPIVVQKFGGTSVADPERIMAAARKAIQEQDDGNQVVVVVSAMGKTTNRLIELAREVTDNPPPRDMDMLLSIGEQQTVAIMSMAIAKLGYKAFGITGPQLGIETNSEHTVARIRSIRTDRIRSLLDGGAIVVAAGFQGVDEEGNITTLGRGGSDTTAVALAAELRAKCDIYTDVDGVYTADPRIAPTARRLEKISYDEMLELASLGAGVMHSRSIEFAKKFAVPIRVISSMTAGPGTDICRETESLEQPVCGSAIVPDEARISIHRIPDQPGTALTLFSAIANENISVDMVVQNKAAAGTADVSFTVMKDDLRKTLRITQSLADQLGAERVTYDDSVSKISVVGSGMAHQPGVASHVFRALADAGININMITTSTIKISVLVASSQAGPALWAIHQAFQLDKPPSDRTIATSPPPPVTAADEKGAGGTLCDELELAINEDLTIEDVWLDSNQSLVTIANIPDKPGLAAAVFENIARDDIVVDMIVQDAGIGGHANLSFTVPREDSARTGEVAERLVQEFKGGPVSENADIAILCVAGVGLRSHAGVAIPMFRALAGPNPDSDGINVRLINTSEVRVSVVVDANDGEEAFQRLKAAFGY